MQRHVAPDVLSRIFLFAKEIAHVSLSPIANRGKNGRQSFAEFRQAVFGFHRDDGINFAVNYSVAFQFAQMLNQNLMRRLRNQSPKFAETQSFFNQVVQDNRLVLAAKTVRARPLIRS